ncbi:hypothetical protein PMKS-004178 [Pichia membranifaciens]|uniref:Transcription factor domain-containing protein n=1 Tax=Pichia membranifaciens TaxID=4926 RepID=A0A1Q2YMF7_9ASCO|nr:hypothetical protein PMKS-004178 [Pichia membranifaciens]
MEIIQINPILKSNSVSLSKLEQEAAEDARYRHLIIKSNEKLEISSLNGCNTWILGVHLTQKEAMFYDSFVKGFMVSVSPQFSHISLQPSTVFIPHGVKQSLVREAFYSCGAAFLCWNSNGLIGDAKQKGHNCTRMIYNFLEHNEIKNNENWLLVAILCLCLRERYLEQDISTTMFHLTTALKIIRKWQEYKLQRYKVGKLLYKKNSFIDRDDEELLPLDIEQAYVNDNIFDGSTEFETMDTHIPGKLKSTYDYNTSESEEIFSYQISEQCFSNTSIIPKIEVTTNERTLIESFIYNYSINLFLCDDSVIRFVASPFKIFKELKPFLINPVYNCSDPSMNNPIMGAALPAFELVAKANWLALKYPLNERGVAIASQIQTHAKLLSCNTPHTSSFSNLPPYLQRRIKESHHLKEIVSNCVWIFMEKLIHPEMSSTCTNIQNLVESTIVLIEKLSLHSPISVICTWPFAILGTVLIHVYQREYLELRISEFDEAVRMKCLSTITHFLSLVWEKHDQDGKGWDVLLDKHFLRQLFL